MKPSLKVYISLFLFVTAICFLPVFTSNAECIDDDGDGYGNPASQDCAFPEEDCDDGDPEVNPGVEESLAAGNCDNGKDDDCDGLTDGDDPACQSPTDQSNWSLFKSLYR